MDEKPVKRRQKKETIDFYDFYRYKIGKGCYEHDKAQIWVRKEFHTYNPMIDPDSFFNGTLSLSNQTEILKKIEKWVAKLGWKRGALCQSKNYHYSDIELELDVWREETDEEYKQRKEIVLANRKRSRLSAVKRKQNKEEKERTILAELKKKYDK